MNMKDVCDYIREDHSKGFKEIVTDDSSQKIQQEQVNTKIRHHVNMLHHL